jgi:nicotinamide mononucleotide transporter
VPAALLELARPLLAPAFTVWGSPVTGLEIAAFTLALAMVLASLRVHPLTWPLAITSSLLYALLFADGKLYGEALLQFFYVAAAVWGWWQWLRGRGAQGGPLVVHRLGRRGTLAAGALTLGAWPLAGAALDRLTDSPVPYADALATVGSIGGQILLGRKVIENWPWWLAVNVFSAGLFASRGLWLTTLLYALLAVLSVIGWSTWLRLEGRARG